MSDAYALPSNIPEAAPDGLVVDPDEEELDPADVPGVLDFLLQAGAGTPQPNADDVSC